MLHGRRLSDADRVYEVLSPKYGRMSLIARGAASSKSKMAGHMPPFAHVSIMVGRGKQDHLAAAVIEQRFLPMEINLQDFILAASLVELTMKVNVGGVAAHEEYALLCDGLRFIGDSSVSYRDKVQRCRLFVWELLSLAGWRPETAVCVMCRNALSGTEAAYHESVGFVCSDHADGRPSLGARIIETLRQLGTGSQTSLPPFDAAEQRRWQQLTQQYYEDIISYPVQSFRLLNYV